MLKEDSTQVYHPEGYDFTILAIRKEMLAPSSQKEVTTPSSMLPTHFNFLQLMFNFHK